MYNPQAFGTTGESRRAVAEVIVVVGEYEAHNEYNYCLVLDTYKNYPDYNIYEVILDDGTITTLKTEDDLNADFDGVNKMVYAYTTDADGWTEFESVMMDTTAADDSAYYVDGGHTDLVEGVDSPKYLVDFGYVYVPFAKWVEVYHDDGGTRHWSEMLADKNPDVIFNAFDVDTDEDVADTVEFEDGQQAVIVYEYVSGQPRVKAAWVIADVDDDLVIPDAPAGDLILKTTLDRGMSTASAATYNTIDKAVKNAAPIRVSAAQAADLNVLLTIDTTKVSGAWFAHYSDSDLASEAATSDINLGLGDYSAGSGYITDSATPADGAAMGQGNIILVKLETTPGNFFYAAYEIVVTGV